MNKQASILITGATGFTGSYIVRHLLAEGYTNIYGLRRSSSTLELLGKAADQIQWRTADIADYFAIEEALSGIEIVVHCAALVSFQPSDKERLLEINRGGTRNVINAALHQKVKRFLHLSSVAALGRNVPGQLISEQSKWEDDESVTQYSRSKFLAELEVWRGQAEGLSVGFLYPSIILGAGRWQEGSVRLFSYAAEGPTYYPDGCTGVVDVRDVADAMVLLLERDEDGDRFLLNGSNVSYQELLRQMTVAFKLEPPSKKLAFFWAKWLARLESIRAFITRQGPLLTHETVNATYQQLVYDSSASENILGLSYRNLEETVQQTAAKYQTTHQQGFGLLE